ncbi:TetR/AcrR family transcriptional regulator [Anaeromyxobacter terrae]|uniref:TetR/AcrR family transcriptional regulator n=1 Tax=Anaeromyxobacter terrae TaxID=2925406 RepID=UPI001F568FB4|nr:TetR/AcrR family transcriptional regulator [Anaeromyxobacter sp. SG22]
MRTPPASPSRSPEEPSTLRTKKYAEARGALFGAAMQLFREKGFDETTAEDIAARAGFSRATFFNHFGTKAAVLRFYGEHLVSTMDETLAAAGAHTPPLERVRRVLLAMARHTERHRDDWKVVFAYSARDPDYLASPTPARLRFLETVTALLSEAQLRGEARRDLPASEQAAHLLALYQRALLAIAVHGRSARAAIDAAWRFATGGIHGGGPVAR